MKSCHIYNVMTITFDPPFPQAPDLKDSASATALLKALLSNKRLGPLIQYPLAKVYIDPLIQYPLAEVYRPSTQCIPLAVPNQKVSYDPLMYSRSAKCV